MVTINKRFIMTNFEQSFLKSPAATLQFHAYFSHLTNKTDTTCTQRIIVPNITKQKYPKHLLHLHHAYTARHKN